MRATPSLASVEAAPVVVLEGHQGCVNSLSWSSDGEYLFSGSDDKKIGVWNVARHIAGETCPYFHSTAHMGNIFDVVPLPERPLGGSISAAMDGTIALNDYESNESIVVFSVAEVAGHEFGRYAPSRCDMALKAAFLPFCSHAFVASVRNQLRLFDLRMRTDITSGHNNPVVCSGRVFEFVGPTSPFSLVVGLSGVFPCDLRCGAPRTSPDYRMLFAEPISGIDISPCGGVTAVSEMESGVSILNTRDIFASGTPIAARSCHSAHKNSKTFLKQPSFFYYQSELCVAHGDDNGRAYFYEVPAEGKPRLRDCALVTDPRNSRSCRSFWRKADKSVCNVVKPHPSMLGRFGGLPVFAASGIDATVKLIQVSKEAPLRGIGPCDDDFRVRVHCAESHLAYERVNPSPIGPPGETFCGNIDENQDCYFTLDDFNEVKLEATANLAANKTLCAMEQYLFVVQLLRMVAEPTCTTKTAVPCRPSVIATIVAMLGNAALAAMKLSRWKDCEQLCSACITFDNDNAKALFRRASARLHLRDLEGALKDVERANSITKGADAAIAQLKKQVESAVTSDKEREKKVFAKLFS